MFRRQRGETRGASGRRLTLLLVALAMVVGFAGSAGAALITGRQIKDGSVTGRDVRDGVVKSADVRDGSLSDVDFDTPVEGDPGDKGPDGTQGAPGFGGLHYEYVSVTLPQTTTEHPVTCPSGLTVLGGGFSSLNDDAMSLLHSAPQGNNGWVVRVLNEGPQVGGFAWAVCSLSTP